MLENSAFFHGEWSAEEWTGWSLKLLTEEVVVSWSMIGKLMGLLGDFAQGCLVCQIEISSSNGTITTGRTTDEGSSL